MCKLNKSNNGRRIDPCMKKFIKNLNDHGIVTIASCCGHHKYPMSIICLNNSSFSNLEGEFIDFCSGCIIHRKKRFYKKDKQGFYYIPEVIGKR